MLVLTCLLLAAVDGGAPLPRVGPPARLTGRIVAEDAHRGELILIDAPPEGVDLAEWRTNALRRAVGTLGSDGTFSLEVPGGDYELQWSRPVGRTFFARP